jgi:3-methyladenine DNA glycosylase Mpg
MSNFNGPNNKNNTSSNSRTISTKKEYLKQIPPLSVSEYESLKQSIKEQGLHVPVIVNKQRIVLDGHYRFRACKELGIPLQYHTMEFKDSLDDKEFVIEVNLRRRQLNEFQRVEIGYSLDPYWRKAAAPTVSRFFRSWMKS